MNILSFEELYLASIDALGLDTTEFEFNSIEVQTCCLRRAASLLCPCSANTLVHAVVEPLRGLEGDLVELRLIAENNVDTLISHGDLLELSRSSQIENAGEQTLLFFAPPAYVRRQSGAVILLGGLADNVSLLPVEIEAQVLYSKHVRVLPPAAITDGVDQLKELGYIEIPPNAWLKTPKHETASKHLSRIDRILDSSSGAGEMQALRILDSELSTNYYRDRWVSPQNHSGKYVGRRPQAYGADIWCYVQLENGSPIKLIDLPLKISSWRGCDEAWRIQAAIDQEKGHPQVFRLQPPQSDSQRMDFFSPVPMWVTRRLEVVGEPVSTPGCLFSYLLTKHEVAEEVRFLHDFGWIEVSQ